MDATTTLIFNEGKIFLLQAATFFVDLIDWCHGFSEQVHLLTFNQFSVFDEFSFHFL
jgi:hypothetical protein